MAGTFYPTKGTLFDAIGDFFDHPWGSRRRYQTYKLWVRQPPRLPLAWHPCCIYERPRGGDERLPAMFHSAGSANPMRSPRPWYFWRPTIAVTSLERNCLSTAVLHRC